MDSLGKMGYSTGVFRDRRAAKYDPRTGEAFSNKLGHVRGGSKIPSIGGEAHDDRLLHLLYHYLRIFSEKQQFDIECLSEFGPSHAERSDKPDRERELSAVGPWCRGRLDKLSFSYCALFRTCQTKGVANIAPREKLLWVR
ncbi:MAG: hypothetical protein NTW27_06795 [Deltaproteobacteria bacterium]|nr:hypothetical protein [Deltaproteobacteria bacterium]